MTAALINLLTLILILSSSLSGIQLFTVVNKKSKGSAGYCPTTTRSHQPALVHSSTRQMEARLMELLRGDRKGAQRLVAHAKSRNPGKSASWYYEKAIYDLERDRK